MRTISARFPSSCATCGNPIPKNAEAVYDDDAKKIYHPGCESQESGSDAEALAERLGYQKHGIKDEDIPF